MQRPAARPWPTPEPVAARRALRSWHPTRKAAGSAADAGDAAAHGEARAHTRADGCLVGGEAGTQRGERWDLRLRPSMQRPSSSQQMSSGAVSLAPHNLHDLPSRGGAPSQLHPRTRGTWSGSSPGCSPVPAPAPTSCDVVLLWHHGVFPSLELEREGCALSFRRPLPPHARAPASVSDRGPLGAAGPETSVTLLDVLIHPAPPRPGSQACSGSCTPARSTSRGSRGICPALGVFAKNNSSSEQMSSGPVSVAPHNLHDLPSRAPWRSEPAAFDSAPDIRACCR